MKKRSTSPRRWQQRNKQIRTCEQCPRLRAHCLRIAEEKRAAYRGETYWGKPVENFGDHNARVLIVGLAPAAHGANRTGRMFTGDRSGDWLFRALHRAGFANQAEATSAKDGLELTDCAITAACHCAPPDNKPTRDELIECAGFLTRTFEIMPVRVVVALGRIGWDAVWKHFKAEHKDKLLPTKKPQFSHLAEAQLTEQITLIGSYHPSQQNTFTGRLTEPMLDAVFERASQLCSQPTL